MCLYGNDYKKENLIDIKHRVNMIKIACNSYKNLEVLDVEMNSNKNFKAIDIFREIKKIYFDKNIFYIMGSDNLAKIHLWKDYDELISKYKYIILERENNPTNKIFREQLLIKKYQFNFLIYKDVKFDISSSMIRKNIRNNLDIKKFVINGIDKYIKDNNLYKGEKLCI